jgi:hypothetical protein
LRCTSEIGWGSKGSGVGGMARPTPLKKLKKQNKITCDHSLLPKYFTHHFSFSVVFRVIFFALLPSPLGPAQGCLRERSEALVRTCRRKSF